MSDDLATLCRTCGMRCDGMLFDRFTLEPDEVESARRHRLPLLASGRGADGGHIAVAYRELIPRLEDDLARA